MIDKIIEYNNRKVLLLDKHIESGLVPDADSADIWVVSNGNPFRLRKFLVKMVLSKNMKIYLKPIFLLERFKTGYQRSEDGEILQSVTDGYISSLENLTDAVFLIEGVESYIKKYATDDKTEDIAEILFDYYYSRNKAIEPVRSRRSFQGYLYPHLEAAWTDRREGYVQSRKVLKKLYDKGFLEREYVDTTYLCNSCEGGFLIYREICTKCGQHNLKVSDIIHHFRCAYVGIQDDFKKGEDENLVCPKCSSELKNLGVDYDKPGKMYVCKNKDCKNEFQNPDIGVFCVNCAKYQAPEELIVRKVYKYDFTVEGIQKSLQLKEEKQKVQNI